MHDFQGAASAGSQWTDRPARKLTLEGAGASRLLKPIKCSENCSKWGSRPVYDVFYNGWDEEISDMVSYSEWCVAYTVKNKLRRLGNNGCGGWNGLKAWLKEVATVVKYGTLTWKIRKQKTWCETQGWRTVTP